LEVLPAAQKALWGELSSVPDEFVLYDGTALALHLGHRTSIDFDFFADRNLNLSTLESTVKFLRNARVIQREKNTLGVIVDRGGPVSVSFFGVSISSVYRGSQLVRIRLKTTWDSSRESNSPNAGYVGCRAAGDLVRSIDPRSWAYWNSKMGRYPPPPLPSRRFGSAPVVRPAPTDMDEIRRRAAERWRVRYGPGRKSQPPGFGEEPSGTCARGVEPRV